MKRIFYSITIVMVLILGININSAMALGPTPNIKTSLSISTSVVKMNEDFSVVIYVHNAGTTDVIASELFGRKNFHLNLQFTYIDSNGKERLITANHPEGFSDAPPPRVKRIGDKLEQVELVEVLPPGWVWKVPFSAKDFYKLDIPTKFSVKAVIPITAYPASSLKSIDGKLYVPININTDEIFYGAIESNSLDITMVGDTDNDGYCYPIYIDSCAYEGVDCDDNNNLVNPGVSEIDYNGIDDDCNPETPDVPLIAGGDIIVKVDKHTVGTGSYPGSTKEPLNNVSVRAFDKSADSCCMANFGVSWHYYESIWLSSENVNSICCKPKAKGTTGVSPDPEGTVTLSLPPGDYLIVGCYNPNESPNPDGDEIYMGVSAGDLQSNQSMLKYLQVIVKADGKKVPAKYIKKQGSELIVIEPEYVEWDGNQELYPFVFDSIGDWTVTTSVLPPDGFTADYGSLTEQINTELEAVQFVLTDVGSVWKETKIEHTIKHKQKTEKVKSKIDVKLSKKLAKKKKLGLYGDGFNPWGQDEDQDED